MLFQSKSKLILASLGHDLWKIKQTSKFSVDFIENIIKLCGAAAYFSLNYF